MYPTIATEQPPSMIGPRALILSDKVEQIKTVKKAPMLGGTVNSCAVTRVYPRLEMMVGRNSEKE